MTPEFVSFGNIFIDDIVLPDGRTFMATPGGAGTHALVGMRVWTDSLGLVAFAGRDLPERLGQELSQVGIDLQGVRIKDSIKTTRAWQLFEPDGRRTEIFRSEKSDFLNSVLDFPDIPSSYYDARGYHLYWAKSLGELPRFIDQLRTVNSSAKLVWEPSFLHGHAGEGELRASLPLISLFSPDEEAACSMTGTQRAEDALERLLDWGAPSVAIRMGATGSILGTSSGERWQIPAVPARIVDVTGAGNAYCGGLVVGLAQRDSYFEAALRGAVSGSFAIEQFGIPAFTAASPAEASARLNWARRNALLLK
jgi:sugar/nucleoside kinase (ribokinase family)